LSAGPDALVADAGSGFVGAGLGDGLHGCNLDDLVQAGSLIV